MTDYQRNEIVLEERPVTFCSISNSKGTWLNHFELQHIIKEDTKHKYKRTAAAQLAAKAANRDSPPSWQRRLPSRYCSAYSGAA
jgi:hypothetical protein